MGIKWGDLRLPPINLYNAPRLSRRGNTKVIIDKEVLMELLKQTYYSGYNDGYANVGSFEDYCEYEKLSELLDSLSS